MPKKFKNKKKKDLPKSARKRRNWVKTATTVAKAAYGGYQIGKYLLNLINVEHKWYDVTNDIATTDWNSSTPVCFGFQNPTGQSSPSVIGIPQGTGASEVIGQSIKLESLFMRGTMSIGPNAYDTTPLANPFCTVRMIIVFDTDTSGSNPSDPTQYGTVNSPMTMREPTRYKILKDKIFTLNVNNSFSHTFKTFKQLDTHLMYDVNNTIYMSGNYYVWFYCDQPAVTGPLNVSPIINFTSRLRFIDN